MKAMMTVNEEANIDPRIAELKQEMFNLCTGMANVANLIGQAEPAWGMDVVSAVNLELGDAVDNVARIPDELARGIIQVAGAHVHTIGRLMEDQFTSPATVAPLARSAVEYSALLIFLNRDEPPEIRTVRAVRALRVGIKEDKDHRQKGLEGTYADLKAVVERYIKKNKQGIPELKHNEIGYSEIVQKTLGGLVEDDLYDLLCSYTHHNTWKAYSQFVVADLNPTKLEIDSLYFAYKSALGLSAAALTLLKLREETASNELREILNVETERILQLGVKIDSFIAEL